MAEKVAGKDGKIHEVVKWPDPVLAKPGETVTVFDAKLKKLVEEMFESMYAAQGIGLAAPQIAISQRITVIDVSFKKNPEEKIVLINPEIIEREGQAGGGRGLPEFAGDSREGVAGREGEGAGAGCDRASGSRWKARSCWRGRCSMRSTIWMVCCLSIG